MPTDVASLTIEVDSRGVRKGTSDLDKFDKQGRKTQTATDKLSNSVKLMGVAFLAAGAAALALTFREAVKSASALEEATGKFNVVFAGQRREAEAMTRALVDGYAMSTREAKQFLSGTQDLLVPMGIASDKAINMSDAVVKLAADLGSFNDMPTADVMTNIQSALTGEFQSMKKFGVILNEARVKQEAFNLGMYSGKGDIDANAKAQAALTLMMRDSEAAQGDQIRTMGSYANQSKKATARLEDLMAAIGEGLLPVFTKFKSMLGDTLEYLIDNKQAIYAVGDGFLTLAKIVGVGSAIYILPMIISAVGTAFTMLNLQVSMFNMLIASGGIKAALTTPLFGTTLAATAATGAVGLLKIAVGSLFALFVGWEIGTWLRDNFQTARLAGLAFVDGTIRAYYQLKYAVELIMVGIGSAWDTSIAYMSKKFAGFLESVGNGLDYIPGMGGFSQSVLEYAEGIKVAAGNTETFAEKQKKLKEELAASLAIHESIIASMLKAELESGATAATGESDAEKMAAAAKAAASDEARALLLEEKAFQAEEDALIAEEKREAEWDREIEWMGAEADRDNAFREQKLQAENDYYTRLYDMQAGSLEAGFKFGQSIRDADAQGALKNGALMLANAAKQSKAGFALQKAFALANAIVTLPSAVMKSFDNGGGYPWGLIPAGLMAAQGAAQISAIKNSSFGGGGSAPSISGGSTSPSAPVASGLPPGTTAVPNASEQPLAQPVRELRVTVEGDGPNSDGMRKFAANLAETIKDMGGTTNLVLS